MLPLHLGLTVLAIILTAAARPCPALSNLAPTACISRDPRPRRPPHTRFFLPGQTGSSHTTSSPSVGSSPPDATHLESPLPYTHPAFPHSIPPILTSRTSVLTRGSHEPPLMVALEAYQVLELSLMQVPLRLQERKESSCLLATPSQESPIT